MIRDRSRHFAWIAALTALVMAIGSAAALAQPIKINFWHGITAADQEGIIALVDRFNQEYEGEIQVEQMPINWGEFYDKLPVSVAGGAAPDVALMHRDSLPSVAGRGILRPIDDLWEKFGLSPDDFLAGVAKETQVNGKRYSVPLDVHPLLLYYNVNDLQRAGIGGPPEDPEEFLQQAKKLTERSGDEVTRWGTRFGMWGPQFYTLLRQRGGDYFAGDDLDQVIIDNEAGLEAMEYIRELMFELEVAPPPEFWPDPYKGEVSLFVDGIWWLKGIQDLRKSGNLDFQVAQADTIYGSEEEAVWAGSHQFVFPNQPTEDPTRLEAAMTFVNFMSENSAAWAAYGQVPVRIDAVQSDEFLSLEDHQVVVQQKLVFFPRVPWGTGDGLIEDFMWRAFDPRNENYTDTKSALLYGKERLQNLIADYKEDFGM